MIEEKEFYLFLNVLFFENILNANEANVVSITDRYLWRRDRARMVVYELKRPVSGHFDYSLSAFKLQEGETIKAMDIDEKGVLQLRNNTGKVKKVYPLYDIKGAKLYPNTLKVLGLLHDIDLEFKIDSKKLAKEYLFLQRRFINEKMDPKTTTFFLSPESGTIGFANDDKPRELPYNILKNKSKEKKEHRFYYVLVKDFLNQANRFDSEITFQTKWPYVTRVRFRENVYALVMHQKEKSI